MATYFGELRDNLERFTALPVAGLHIDAVRGGREVEAVAARLSDDQHLSVGTVDGRNVRKTDLARAHETLAAVARQIGTDRLMVGASCSLIYRPVRLASETRLNEELMRWLAFAEEKLGEIVYLANAVDGRIDKAMHAENAAAMANRGESRLIQADPRRRRQAPCSGGHRVRLQSRLGLCRARKASARQAQSAGLSDHHHRLLSANRRRAQGALPDAEYDRFIEQQIDVAVAMQEEMGFDMLVHGEFERNDMVEYFGEQLEGYAFTKLGWVQSYGSRYVKPPIIYGDVSRPAPMTVKWSKYAQSRTERPMKGMLTGPVTRVQWAFVRDDQPRACRQEIDRRIAPPVVSGKARAAARGAPRARPATPQGAAGGDNPKGQRPSGGNPALSLAYVA